MLTRALLLVAIVATLTGCPPFMRPGSSACAQGPRITASATP